MVKHIWNPRAASASGGKSAAYKSAILCTTFFVVYGIACLLAEPVVHKYKQFTNRTYTEIEYATGAKFENPLFKETIEFRTRRWPVLLGLTLREAKFGRRTLASLVLGSLIGLERRESNRGAGIRTMSLVSLGSCLFTISSSFCFEDGTQGWDSARVAAALPSGVGFLGGALIIKQDGQIKGLTTACGVWLSCAVGQACGEGLYVVAFFTVSVAVATLRFGPRAQTEEATVQDDDAEEDKGVKLEAVSEELHAVAEQLKSEPLSPLPKARLSTLERRVSRRASCASSSFLGGDE